MCDAAIPEHDVDEGAQTRFRKYATYKDSGIAWLGEVPAHWEVKPLKYLSHINRSALSESTDPDYEFDYVDIGSVSPALGIAKTERKKFASAPSRARRLVQEGDVLVSTVRTYLRAIAPIKGSAENLVVSTGFCVVSPRDELKSAYCSYLLQSTFFVETVVAQSVGVSYPATNASDIANIKIPLPDAKEQQKIAAFLDKETAQIAALVDEQTRLIRLLREKRQAVISNAVTKGLNPNAKMKDSGIEWLGEVPAGWTTKKLKFVARVQPSNVNKKSKENEERIRLCNYTDVYYNEEITADLPFMKATASDAQIRKFTLKKGDIIITKDSEDPNDIAVPAYVPQDLQGVVCGYHLALLRPKDGTFGGYLKRVMDSRYARSFFATRANGITRYGLGIYAISNFILPIPPTQAEQKEIADYLDRETERIDALVETCETAIGLLKERRTALISAAVTGKIDVRNVG